MSDRPDLSLPARAPSVARYHDQPMTLHPAALYTLVDMTDAEFQDLQRDCEAGCIDTGSEPGNSVRPAPRPLYVGQPLRAVFDYHLELGTQNRYDPRYFIIAVEKDWQDQGVILVTLDDDDLQCNVDSFRIKARDSGLSLVNLQTGNSSWDEEKEGYEFIFNDGDRDDDDEDGSGDDNGGKDRDNDDDDGPPAPTKNIPLGYYIPIYIHSSLSEDQVVMILEPSYKMKSPEHIGCRVQAKLTPAPSGPGTSPTQDIINQATALHPRRCARNRYLHKTYILVIDTADPVENGMLVVKLPSTDASRSAPTERTVDTFPHIRLPYSCHNGLQTRFLNLANGTTKWPSDDIRAQSVFAVFQYDTHSKELEFSGTLLDPGAGKRKPGEHLLLYAQRIFIFPGKVPERVSWDFDEAVRRFPWFCRLQRFAEGLDTKFFICLDGDDVVKTGVLLVRRDWDESLWDRTDEELLNLPIEGVKNVRVPMKEALAILEKGRKGQLDGMSEDLKILFS